MTFKQAKDRDGHVRKGEKSTPIVFFKKLDIEDKETGEEKKIPMLRKYNVFNVEQVDGIDAPDLQEKDPDAEEVIALPSTGDIFNGYRGGPALKTSGGRACYSPLRDTVNMPMASDFENAAAHASVLFHELIHSTGHSKRLDRGLDTKLAPFGSPDYSKEELIAECGAAFLCATTGILPQTIDQSAAYINGWRKKLKGDKRLVVTAAAAAQRAVDHILGVTWDDPRKQEPETQDHLPGADVSDQDLDRVMELAAPVNSGSKEEDLGAALQAFPRPGQANLNSTATREERSAYISAILTWWNQHAPAWEQHGVIDPRKNPVVNAEPAQPAPLFGGEVPS